MFNTRVRRRRHVITAVNGEVTYADGAELWVRCRLQPYRGEEALRNGGDRTKYYARMHAAPDADIMERDHIVDKFGHEWYVTSVIDADHEGVFLVVELERPRVEGAAV